MVRHRRLFVVLATVVLAHYSPARKGLARGFSGENNNIDACNPNRYLRGIYRNVPVIVFLLEHV